MGKAGQGDFFAIDRRVWRFVCAKGLNASIAYLVLARGTGGDQRTTSWSTHSIEMRTSLSRTRGKSAVGELIASGVIDQRMKGPKGGRPTYYLQPAHLIVGCEGRKPDLNGTQDVLWSRLQQAPSLQFFSYDKTDPALDYRKAIDVADELVRLGAAERHNQNHYRAVPYDAAFHEKPQWIWLPNSIVDGAAGETSPVERLRMAQEPKALRLLVELYDSHDLPSDGGLHWRMIRQEYERHSLARPSGWNVWWFAPSTERAYSSARPIAAFLDQSKKEEDGGKDAKGKPTTRVKGWGDFWSAWALLKREGLLEIVPHIIEADNDQADIHHPFGLSAADIGEEIEQRLGDAARCAATAFLPDRPDLSRSDHILVPVRPSMPNVAAVGIARLRYRPRTGATSEWASRAARWEEWIARYGEIEQTAGAASAKVGA